MLYQQWRDYYGRDDDDTLVVRGSTLQFNPTFDAKLIAKHLRKDSALYSAEYLSEWRDDLQSYLTRAQVEEAVARGVTVRPPDPRLAYESFCDMSDGQKDSSCISIVHKIASDSGGGEHYVQDCLIEVAAPHDTEVAVATIAGVLARYGLKDTMGDDHSRKWVIGSFRRHGIEFKRPMTIATPESPSKYMTRSDLYAETLPLFSSGQVTLLDSDGLVGQYCELERRILSSGHQRIDHPNRSGFHDDLANCTAGSLWRISQAQPEGICTLLGRDPVLARQVAAAVGASANPYNPIQLGPQGQFGERAMAQMRRAQFRGW